MPGPPACGRGPTRYIHVDMYLHRAPSINKLCHPRWYVEQPREAILETYSRIDARDHDHGVTRTPSSAIHTQKVNLPNPTALSADSTPLWLFAIGIRFTSPPPHRSSNGALAHGAPNARRTSRRANKKRCSLMLHWGPRAAAAAPPPIWSLTCSFALAAATQLSIATPGA